MAALRKIIKSYLVIKHYLIMTPITIKMIRKNYLENKWKRKRIEDSRS